MNAVFLISGNFDNKEAVTMMAWELGKPVLLWGPRDEAPLADGAKYTNGQCGLSGISWQLRRLNIPFIYTENC